MNPPEPVVFSATDGMAVQLFHQLATSLRLRELINIEPMTTTLMALGSGITVIIEPL